jgi:hypothetical protein
MDTQTRSEKPDSGTRKTLKKILGWIFPGLGIFLFAALLVSPWFGERLDRMFEDTARTQAHIQSCQLLRHGNQREHAIQCAFSFEYNAKTYQTKDYAWSTQSAFATPGSLDRELKKQSARGSATVDFRPRHPQDAAIADERWLATPPLWAVIVALLGIFFAVLIHLEPSATVYRRADLVRDPATGELVEINSNRKTRATHLALGWICALGLAMLACLYGLSNWIGNDIATLGFSSLRKVPAQLMDCTHHFHGSTKGHDQIECAFAYQWNGQPLKGEADAIDFRFIATDARMDEQVAQINQQKDVWAYVDPHHPEYAWAFISNDWFLPYSWGIFELMLLVMMLGVLPALLANFIKRAMNGGGS